LRAILDRTAERIDGFESPLGLELLATVDWLIESEHCESTLPAIREGLNYWTAGPAANARALPRLRETHTRCGYRARRLY